MVSLHAAALLLAVSAGGETVLLDFTADWCGPCREMRPTVEALAAKGHPVRAVNVDQHRDLAAQHRIGAIPCFVMLVDGREVARETGHTSLSRLEQMCQMGQASQSGRGGPRATAARTVSAPSRTKGGLPIPVVQLGAPTMPALVNNEGPAGRATAGADQGAAGGIPPDGPADPPQAVSDDDLIASTVRIRIEDGGGQSCGSGTIIDARQGQALVLTCGHVFRDSRGQGRIEVDLFGPNPARKVPGRLVGYDEKRDVGLVAITVPGAVRAARVAPPGYAVAKGDPVASVGCNHGADPTVRHSRVVSIDRYQGAPNLQIADQPVEGRSGGGLFTPDGLVIGVCNAADPADREGLFAALGAIHAQLDAARFQFVYHEPPSTPRRMPRPPETVSAAESPRDGAGPRPDSLPLLPAAPAASGADRLSRADNAETPRGVQPGQLTRQEQAALDEMRRRSQRAEVIFIVRPLDRPQAESEVYVLHDASPAMLERLAAGAQPTEIRETSLAVPSRATPPQANSSPARLVLPPPVPQR